MEKFNQSQRRLTFKQLQQIKREKIAPAKNLMDTKDC